MLPCDVKDFRQFVSGLLGKPQEELGRSDGHFHVEPKDISNIFHLVNQRVAQQNEGSLIHLSITVLYDNGTSITHNSVEQFESYYPTSQTVPKEVVLSFTYLIKFQTKDAPEKQEIEVVLSTDDNRLHQSDAWLAGGLFEYRIHHTDRTWSSDIANVLSNHSSTFMDKQSAFTKWVKRHTDEIFEITFWIVLASFSTYWYLSTKNTFFSDNATSLNALMLTEHLVTISFLGIVLVTFLKVVEKVAEYTFYIRTTSFITLIDRDYETMKKKKATDFNKKAICCIAWVLNVIAGIAATAIYNATLS